MNAILNYIVCVVLSVILKHVGLPATAAGAIVLLIGLLKEIYDCHKKDYAGAKDSALDILADILGILTGLL